MKTNLDILVIALLMSNVALAETSIIKSVNNQPTEEVVNKEAVEDTSSRTDKAKQAKIESAKLKLTRILYRKLAKKILPELGEDAFDLMIEIQSKDQYFAEKLINGEILELANKADKTGVQDSLISANTSTILGTIATAILTSSANDSSNDESSDSLGYIVTGQKYSKYGNTTEVTKSFRLMKNGTLLKAAILSAASASSINYITSTESMRTKSVEAFVEKESLENARYSLQNTARQIANSLKGPLGLKANSKMSDSVKAKREEKLKKLRSAIYDKLNVAYEKYVLGESLTNIEKELNLYKIIRKSGVVSEERIDAYQTIVDLFINMEQRVHDNKVLMEMDENKFGILKEHYKAIEQFYLSTEAYAQQQLKINLETDEVYSQLQEAFIIVDQLSAEDIRELAIEGKL